MKRLLWLIVCLMTMVLSVNAQKSNLLRIRQAAINFHKTTLKAPSTFILTDRYGNRVSINSIHVELIKGGKCKCEKRKVFSREISDIYDIYLSDKYEGDSVYIYTKKLMKIYMRCLLEVSRKILMAVW